MGCQLHPEQPRLHRTLALAHWKRREFIAAAGDWCKAIYLYVRNVLTSEVGVNC
jgi:hypothetical protein